jgi:heat shock protein HslJ
MNKRISILIAGVGLILIAGFGILLVNKDEPTVETITTQTASSNLSELVNKPWSWQKAVYSNGTIVTANDPENFIIVFNEDGTFSSTTDCNNLVGKFTIDLSSLTFNDIASTQMFCENSQEQTYSAILHDSKSYTITADGNLQIQLNTNAGVASFNKQ